jgi:hypothetical protein
VQKRDFNAKMKELVQRAMDEKGGVITLEEIVEIIRPHYEYVIEDLVEKDLKRTARYILSRSRYYAGIRNFFSNKKRRVCRCRKCDGREKK